MPHTCSCRRCWASYGEPDSSGNYCNKMFVVHYHIGLGGFAFDCVGEAVELNYFEVLVAMLVVGEDGGSCKIDDWFILLILDL